MFGIYKFENKINGKVYIGQSTNLEERYKAHKRKYKTENSYFYNGLRKWGWENFSYEVLIAKDYISKEELNELEIKYIEKYNSYNNGYNMNKGGNYTSSDKKLSQNDIEKIIELLQNTNLTFLEIGNNFNVSPSNISMINSGTIWTQQNLSYPIRKNKNNNAGDKNPNNKITEEMVMKIREDFVNMTLTEIQIKYSHLCSKSELKKICYGVQFKHLPIYKKYQKQWFLNGSCIDYPRLEE